MSVFIPMGVIGFAYKYVIARNLACFLALVISVFSSDSSNFNLSAINCFMSSLILIQSSLLPITPMRKSSAYLTYFRRFMSASISSLAGYFRRSLTTSSICFQSSCCSVSFFACFSFVVKVVFFSAQVVLLLDFLCSFSLIQFLSVFFDVFVELVKIDICQYRTYYPTLWCSAIRFVKYPIFHISGIQKLSDKA